MVAPVAPVAPVARAIVVPAVTREGLITSTMVFLVDYMPMVEVVVPAVEGAMVVVAAMAAMAPQACPTRWPWSPAAACKAAKPPVTTPSLAT